LKKVKVKLPGGGTIEVEEYETPIEDGASAREYGRLLDEEQAFDRKLDTFAKEVADRMEAAEQGESAREHWLVGRLILDHEKELEPRQEAGGLREYEHKGRSRERLMDKVAEIRKDRGAAKERFSVHYLRKFKRFAGLLTEKQVSRPVPYSLQHELIYDWLTEKDRDELLARCESGEFRTSTQLRRAVADFRKKGQPTGEATVAVTETDASSEGRISESPNREE